MFVSRFCAAVIMLITLAPVMAYSGSLDSPASPSGTTTVSAGYYEATTLSAGDADLVTGNIKSGVTIFGVSGSSTVVETGGGNAVSSDILSGKIAYVSGGTVTGNIATQTLSNGTTTVSAGYYNATDLATVDADLVAANIKSGVNVFGIDGSASSGSSVGVPKTGQTTSYSATGGEDGDLQKGVAWPNPRFTDNGNGTVTDNLTGLIWLKNANAAGQKTWENALLYCNTLANGSAGLTDGSAAGDWRLPNVKELQSLIHYGVYNPALPNTVGTGKWTEGDPFSGVQSFYYWSGTTFSFYTADAWYVNLSVGNVRYGNKTYAFYVWPVSAGQ